jgi:hypothetical protein
MTGSPPATTSCASPLARFVGHPAYDISQLRGDLQRLAFLLGADNEDQLFGQ